MGEIYLTNSEDWKDLMGIDNQYDPLRDDQLITVTKCLSSVGPFILKGWGELLLWDTSS